MILHLSTQFAYAKHCHLFSSHFCFLFPKILSLCFYIKTSLRFLKFQSPPPDNMQTQNSHMGALPVSLARNISNRMQSKYLKTISCLSVFYITKRSTDFSREKLKTSERSYDLSSTCHAFSSDLSPLYQCMLCQLIHTAICGCYT